jgi:putative transposase
MKPVREEDTAMSKRSTQAGGKSSPDWEHVEEWARQKVQELIQSILEEEVTELLGREKSERRKGVDSPPGYRNGYGKPRRLTLSNGTISLRRPRVRGLEERFESRILPLFTRRTKEVRDLLPELYLHGLAEGDFEMALRGLLGDGAPLSPNSIARLKAKWEGEYEEWSKRRFDDLEVTYLWVDGVYVKAGLEKDKAALLVVLAAAADGHKEVVAVVPGHRESTESWSEVLRDLKGRGMGAPRLVVGDGHLGIWGGLRNVYPEVGEQRCWNHRIVNIMNKVPKKHQRQALIGLRRIPYAESRREALRLKEKFQVWCRERGFGDAAELIDKDWDRMVTFYEFPKEHWQHLRTTNPIESPFAALRLRTDAARRYKKVENATTVIWKMLMIAGKRFRRLRSPELMRDVYLGVKYEDGERVQEEVRKDAA